MAGRKGQHCRIRLLRVDVHPYAVLGHWLVDHITAS